MNQHTERLNRILNLLELATLMHDDDRLGVHLTDIAANVQQAIARHQKAEYLGPEDRAGIVAASIAALEKSTGLAFPDPPAEPDADDPRIDQLENLYALAVRTCFSDAPSTSEIRRLAITAVRLEKQLESTLLDRGVYTDKEACDRWADDLTQRVVAFSRENLPKDDWHRAVDELLGAIA